MHGYVWSFGREYNAADWGGGVCALVPMPIAIPISSFLQCILSPVSKILEKVMYEQLYNYFTKNKIFSPALHGYRQHRSTQTALIRQQLQVKSVG